MIYRLWDTFTYNENSVLERGLLKKALILVLQPAVKFCLRHSIKLQDLHETLKLVLVRVAAESLEKEGHRANASRVSLMTGVHRKDVLRITSGDTEVESDSKSLMAKIFGQWSTDRRFVTKAGEPKVLSVSGERSEFAVLCNSVSKDVNAATILFELERIGAVEATKGGIRLVHQSYVPKGDILAGFSIFSEDCECLLDAVEENVLTPQELPQLHARTSFDNVRPEALPEIRRWLLKHGHEFHSRVRDFLGSHDQDINPNPKFKGKGVKVSFGSFSNSERKKVRE